MKRFVIGFILGVGLMYWYLQHSGANQWNTTGWFDSAASGYRDDKQHEAARRVLEPSESPR